MAWRGGSALPSCTDRWGAPSAGALFMAWRGGSALPSCTDRRGAPSAGAAWAGAAGITSAAASRRAAVARTGMVLLTMAWAGRGSYRGPRPVLPP
ncbi:hypothetical protein DMB66_48900 [Actinoplanes sp. ATCC 53533]|nr:hypothetical protein DMB66_48900 [Actinoplanes sp. ATCC 53533]